MGLGKTVVTLTAIDQLIYDRLEIDKVLIVAPKKVAEATWQDEAAKWGHLRHLRISTVLGTEKQRKAALAAQADIYIINRENVPWLVHTLGRSWDFDMVVLDEASSFKNHAAQRFKALKAVRPRVHKVVELTGTPRPNSLLDLWAQIYLLDQGERLGRYITHYRKTYFWPTEYSYEPREGAAEAVEGRIKDIVLSFKAADHLTLPEKIIDDIPVVLDTTAQRIYKKLEKDYLLEVNGETITRTLTVLPKDFGTAEVEAEEPAPESANAQFRSAIWPLYEAAVTAKQWQGGFVPPAEDSMTLVDYGQIKVTNGQQGSRSNSTKLYTIPGAPCRAAANGTVVFAGNLELTGNTVVIDHGCGLRSYLYGLQELSVSKGQTVEKGQAVGALGEELTMDFKLGSRSVNPRLLFQTSGGLFWKEND